MVLCKRDKGCCKRGDDTMKQRDKFYKKQFGWVVGASHHAGVGVKICSVFGACTQTTDALQIHDVLETAIK